MLEDLRIIELASVLAGPSVGMFFAELGAEVIKVENSMTGGDVTRSWKLPSEDQNSASSAYFACVNFSKTHIFKDLSNPSDNQEVVDLIAGSDVVIANFKEGSAEKLGMDMSSLQALNSELIYVNLSGFEHSKKPAYDIVLQAETGWLSMTGTQNELAKTPVAMIDILAAHQMKEAILLALIKKEKTGKGSFIDLSLERSSLASLANQASNYLNESHIAKPLGTLHPNIAPYGEIISSSDNIKFVLAIGSDQQFKSLCEILTLPIIAEDERFATNKDRVENRTTLAKIFNEASKKLNSTEFQGSCDHKKVPVGRIRNMEEVMNSKAAIEMTLLSDDGLKRISQLAFSKEDLSF